MIMKSKLIVIEGVDSSGKATQSKILYDKLTEMGYNTGSIEFPNYANDSSAVVKMYLNGDFGKDPDSVSAYAASMFFAVTAPTEKANRSSLSEMASPVRVSP